MSAAAPITERSMERMIESYGSDPNAKDLCRVLRVPGFLNRKHGRSASGARRLVTGMALQPS